MEEFDAVIIGSGAGGAPVAYTLVRAGKRVLVLEKGPALRTQDDLAGNPLSDFKRDELFGFGTEHIVTTPGMANTGASFYPSIIEPDLNDEPHLHSTTANAPDTETVVTIEGYTAQALGGGTQLYGAVSLRFPEHDFKLASFNAGRQLQNDPAGDALKDVRDWPISYQELEPFYTKAEHLIGINGTRAGQLKPISLPAGTVDPYQPPVPPNPISAIAAKGMTAIAARELSAAAPPPYRTPLAVLTQDHAPSGRIAANPKTAYVNRYGDPLGLKSNTWVALLRPTLRAFPDGLTIRCNCVVTHLEAVDDRIERVHYRDPSGREQVVKGKVVVVACSAIESVRLLLISAENDPANLGARFKLGTNAALLGRFFLTHCFGGAELRLKAGEYRNGREWHEVPGRRFDKSISLDSDFATDFTSHPAWIQAQGMWAGAAIYNNTSDQALPLSLARTHGSTDLDTLWQGFMNSANLYGDALLDWLRSDFGTRLSVSFMANQVPQFDNQIRLHNRVRDKWGRKVAHIVKDWHPHDQYVMQRCAEMCRDILAEGARAHFPGIRDDEMSIEFGSVYGVRVENTVRVANHILGGARFGDNSADSVLDRDCKVWELANLYVTDGSFMPTSGGANPTLTIQANAFRVGELLIPRF